jgi:hypothetical protein
LPTRVNKQTLNPADTKAVQEPQHISASESVHWLAVENHIDDDCLRSLFKREGPFLERELLFSSQV